MKRFLNICISFIFISILLLFSISYVFSEDSSFSENENRPLQELPTFSKDKLLSGEFTDNIDNYINDQFIFRDKSINIKTNIKRKLGNKDINNVYLCKEGYLIEKLTSLNLNNIIANTNYINNFKDHHNDLNISFMPIPTSSYILKDKLPSYSFVLDQEEILDTIEDNLKDVDFINITKTLLDNKDKYIYYKLDHHWTSLGAYLAYKDWCNHLDIIPTNYDVTLFTKDFKGSLYSKVLDNKMQSDEIYLYNIKNNYSFFIDNTKKETIYNLNSLNEKDKYKVFFDGNHSEFTIKTKSQKLDNILIIKDSYANSFIPYLIEDYKNIHVLDLRYFNGNINDYIQKNNIDNVLFLYNIVNFSKDKNLYKL